MWSGLADSEDGVTLICAWFEGNYIISIPGSSYIHAFQYKSWPEKANFSVSAIKSHLPSDNYLEEIRKTIVNVNIKKQVATVQPTNRMRLLCHEISR